ncbi:putative intracellular protease/amidase [Streptococcus gallinaceus]|uniref:DJ-1/PfpI family protein n=1 Tax=Streptococcus gallinaceus TaxID=165758 RepID=UPI0020A1DDA9|nr:DJ-1/PfpI family protein [Streptococcus gallinaceus]MCP1638318.1 putative intracellular protease/amidase [Streptococcus gallinaceus]MCP1769595.1 putative intracellular protease/amidase [Streptococcus gallinaceus]
MKIVCVVFDDFEALDLFGPVEFLSGLPDAQLPYVSMDGGLISTKQGIQLYPQTMRDLESWAILLLPGGMGTRKVIENPLFLERLNELVNRSRWVLSVCTGSALWLEVVPWMTRPLPATNVP